MVTSEQTIPPQLDHPGFSSGPVLRDLTPYRGEVIHEEEVLRLDRARVVFADHALLQHDFPQLRDDALLETNQKPRSLEGEARARALDEIREQWLLDKAAYISVPQTLQETVNDRIPVRDVRVKAYRPYHYGRALIMSVARVNACLGGGRSDREPGLLDIKGTGVGPGKAPHFRAHGNGLLDLPGALREIIFGRLTDRILTMNGYPCRAVPNYAIIDAGFNRRYPWQGTVPAAILVRRAHRRPAYRFGIKDPHCREVGIERDIELLLRRYGLTSTGADTNLFLSLEGNRMVVEYGESNLVYSPGALAWIFELTGFRGEPMEIDGMNLQFTREVEADPPAPQIVDFGSFFYHAEFTNPIVSLVASRPCRIGEVIHPGDPDFVQPDPALMPPPDLWLKNEIIPIEEEEVDWDIKLPDPQDSITAIWSLQYRSGELTAAELMAEVDAYLATVPGIW